MTRDEAIMAANEAAAYLSEEADFNLSWTDGRRGSWDKSPEYTARRIELARQRESWVTAITTLTLAQAGTLSNAAIEAAAKSLATTVVGDRSPDQRRPGDGLPRWKTWEDCARKALEAVEREERASIVRYLDSRGESQASCK